MSQPIVVAWGGGVNSTAMLIGMRPRQVRPDLILFADPGGEKPETYAYRDAFQSWLEGVGFPPIITVRNDGKYIGIDKGEEYRARIVEDDSYHYRYPLIEWGWWRDECVAAIVQEGLAVPPKSACFFCPATTKKEILRLGEEHPKLLERALALERGAAASLVTVKGLGRRFAWADFVAQARIALPLFRNFEGDQNADDIACMCYDGGPS